MRAKKTSRHKARRYALQACYQWQMTHVTVEEIGACFAKNTKNDSFDDSYFIRLLYGAIKNIDKIDQHIDLCSSCEFKELTPIELSILRIATYELMDCQDVPYRVIINEALELSKVFGSTDQSFKYINGVLDKIATTLRRHEINHCSN